MSTTDIDIETIPTLPKEPKVPEEVVILRQARDYIAQPRKWARGHWGNKRSGSRCALGAINLFSEHGDEDERYTPNTSRGRAMKALDEAIPHHPHPFDNVGIRIMNFNDNARKANVVAAFNTAINNIMDKKNK